MHLQTCGTKYRGCDPDCPKDLRERIEVLRDLPHFYGKATAIAVLEARVAIAELDMPKRRKPDNALHWVIFA